MPPKPRPSSKARSFDRRVIGALVGAAVIVLALVAASLLLGKGDDETAPPVVGDTALVDGIPQQGTVLGDPAAKVTLLVYEDIQCPFCRQYTIQMFPEVVENYVRPGKAKVDFRGLAFLGEDSTQALQAVLAAGKQDRAWQMIELLFANQGEENSGWVTDVLIEELAASIDGLDVEQLKQDMESADIQAEIDATAAEAQERGIGGTPWFFVRTADGELIEVTPEGLDAAKLASALDDALQR